MENKIIHLEQNKDHVWWSYRELIVDNFHIMRSVRIYEWWYNSLHYHPVDEIQIVESGYIKYYWEEDGEIKNKILKPWDVTFVKANTPHRIEFVDWNCKENGVRFAQIYELVIWEHQNDEYEIKRKEWAKKANILPWEIDNNDLNN